MEGGGLSRRLINFANACVGHLHGGLAIVTVVTCLFFGAISGSGPATVAAIGGIIVPFMIKAGYPVPFSLSLVAASGCLGVIIPPSIPMIMYSVATGASVGTLFMSGFIPGILCALSLSLMAYYISRKNHYQDVSQINFELKNVWKTFKEAVWALLVPIIILGGIYGGFFTPTEAAVIAVFYGLIAGIFIYRELNFKAICKCLATTSLTTASILIIVTTGSTLGEVLTINQVPSKIATYILSLTENPYVFMIILNVFLLLVGCILDTTAAILILSPILLPIASAYGFHIVHFGLIMVINMAIGMITPPVGLNLFTAKSLGDATLEKLSVAVLPFLIMLIISILIISFFPNVGLLIPKIFGNIPW
jgi:C4-dicarboxylate transporter DctM subunit